MCSNAFKRRLNFDFTVSSFNLKQLCTTFKMFHTKALVQEQKIKKLTVHYLKTRHS